MTTPLSRIWVRCHIVLGLILGIASSAHGRSLAIERSIAFAEHLAEEGEYYRAVTEFRRAIFLDEDGPLDRQLYAVLGIGRAYYDGGAYLRCSEWCRKYLNETTGRPEWPVLQRLSLLAMIKAGDAESALAFAQRDPHQVSRFCGAVAQAYQGDWAQARDSFGELGEDAELGTAAAWNESLAIQALEANRKSPRLAATLSIVPGLGYWYADHKQSAVSALFINGLLIGSAVSAFHSSMYELGGALSFFGAGWYAGNIYGAYYSATRFNQRVDDWYINQLSY